VLAIQEDVEARVANAIKLRGVWFSYAKGQPVLKGIDLHVPTGSCVILLGSNGSGKTTLIKLINGLLKPERGSVEVLGREITSESDVKAVQHKIGYIPQQLGLVRSMTVLDNVLVGALPRCNGAATVLKVFPDVEVEYAREVLEIVGIRPKMNEKLYHLSGGERQRVAIARALMVKPRIILADEFTSDLDYVGTRKVMDIMSTIKEKGVTLLVSMHNIAIATEYGDKLVLIKRGEKIGEVGPAELSQELVWRVFG